MVKLRWPILAETEVKTQGGFIIVPLVSVRVLSCSKPLLLFAGTASQFYKKS